jgi:hypothetical protein
MSTMDKKKEARIWMKMPTLHVNRIKIGENYSSIILKYT